MLSLQHDNSRESSHKYTPHLLPCKIHHSGPVTVSPQHWNPKTDKDGHPESYFRGRKLKGRGVKVPEGYKGVVVKEKVRDADGEQLSRAAQEDEDEEDGDEEEEEEVKVLEEVGGFEEFVVWGHERGVEGDDVFVRGVEEWVGFAGAIHAPGLPDGHGEVEKGS